MKIAVKQKGGFAGGMQDLGNIDTQSLTAAAEQRIESLVQTTQDIGFFNLPPHVGALGADIPEYEITVSDGQRQYTVTFHDDGSPEYDSLRQLVQTVIGQRGP